MTMSDYKQNLDGLLRSKSNQSCTISRTLRASCLPLQPIHQNLLILKVLVPNLLILLLLQVLEAYALNEAPPELVNDETQPDTNGIRQQMDAILAFRVSTADFHLVFW